MSLNFRYEKSGFESFYTHDRYNGKIVHSKVNLKLFRCWNSCDIKHAYSIGYRIKSIAIA